MTSVVETIGPGDTIREAAERMRSLDVGCLPVAEDDHLIGMLTDRDIVLRAVSLNRGPETLVRDVMSDKVKYCYDDDSIAKVAQNMAELGIRRLPVVNRGKRLVGMLALSNLVHCGDSISASTMVRGVATPH